MRYIVRGLSIFGSLALLVLIVAWFILSSSLMTSQRTAFVENLIAEKIGQDVVIKEGVRVGIGRQLQVSAATLVLPGALNSKGNLAIIDQLAFDVSAKELWKGKISLSNLSVRGIHLNLITTADGETSWQNLSVIGDSIKNSAKVSENSMPGILVDQVIELSEVTLLYQSALNGLDFDLKFGELALTRRGENNEGIVQGSGSLNGETFKLKGTFPTDEPFHAKAEFDYASIVVDQIPRKSGLEVRTAIAIAELGQLLDILKLNRVIEGTGDISATFKSADNKVKIDDLDVNVDLSSGQSLEVTGQIGELKNPADVSLTTRIRLYPEKSEPAPAESRFDLKLIAVDMVIDSVPGQVAKRQMVIKTNGFTLDTSGVGPPPIQFSELSRTPAGTLRVGNVNFWIGKRANPLLVMKGAVEDALQLREVSINGHVDIPGGSFFSPELAGSDAKLGKFLGGFLLKGDLQELSLQDLNVQTSETDIWDFEIKGSVGNILKLESVDLGVVANVHSGAALLASLSREPLETGKLELMLNLASSGTNWSSNAKITVSDSILQFEGSLDDATANPVLSGKIESDRILIDQLRSIILAVGQLRQLDKGADNDKASEEAGVQKTKDNPEVLRDVTLSPIGRSILTSGLDMNVAVDLRHIEGSKGSSSLKTELTLNETEFNVGPVEFEYGEAHFNVKGNIDLSDDAHLLKLTGDVGGWKLDDILHSLNFKKGASGTIYANFTLTGGTESIKQFVGSMNGDAVVSMRKGSIETRLLDLAGLGLLPWVFSKEKKKITPLVCLRAPLNISGGNVSTKKTTLETNEVQVVVFGKANLKNKTVDLNIQPRKIGKPLSRSPWPVTVKGPVSDPKIKVKDGPKRLKRKDGAHQMPTERKLCVPDILQLK